MKLVLKFVLGVLTISMACSIHPDTRFSTSGSRARRKENTSYGRDHGAKSDAVNRQSADELAAEQNDIKTHFALEIQRFMGAPYVWGGASPAGTDCSGLVRTVFRRALGVDLPRNTAELYKMGISVNENELKLGDLVFFSNAQNSHISHVGIYLDQGKFVHASLSAGVTISDLFTSWYQENFRGARRVIDDSTFEKR